MSGLVTLCAIVSYIKSPGFAPRRGRPIRFSWLSLQLFALGLTMVLVLLVADTLGLALYVMLWLWFGLVDLLRWVQRKPGGQ